MKVSIIIPVRNEELVIKKTIEQLENELSSFPCEIIFVNDFSSDKTFELIKEISDAKEQINLYNNKKKAWVAR